ncbi:MAG: pyrimidine-nucleoside phosphorylase [Acidobacteria bacterium]|nr:pyrimidine-nucleoside phosphorylase [Acidobacteriota bacterium]
MTRRARANAASTADGFADIELVAESGASNVDYTGRSFMSFVDVIAKKRDGDALSHEDIDAFVQGVGAADIPDYQASALLMAIVLRGMSDQETAWLTDAMVRSGERVDLSGIPGTKVGKHSTGGVGDKVSIVLAPVVAACGVVLPKMSGRGLGHTGGTLDKLEAIPGFRVNLSIEEFRRMLADVGTSIVGQTSSLAPADKKLYALRDVTATVPSIPLIAASVMSKKLAEGAGALVLDVKCGHGAFMKSDTDARELARLMVSIGSQAGLRTEAFITDMDAPLGRAVGNAVEIVECIETLKGQGPDDISALVVVLASRMLVVSGRYGEHDAEPAVRGALSSGKALEKMRAMVEWQGGDVRVLDDYERLPGAARRHAIAAGQDGYVAALQADLIGRASMALGAGRQRIEDRIDHGAGVWIAKKPGDRVCAGETILELLYNDGRGLGEASALAHAAIRLTAEPPVLRPLVLGTVA